MSLLRGRNREKNLTGELYGKYSFGNMYNELLSEEHIANIVNIIKNDFEIAGIIDKYSSLKIMDVGTGRQALAMALLGVKTVEHYDISKEHVNRFKKLLKKKKYSSLNILTRNLDLCKQELPKNKYDFVYLSGIVHHFSNTAKGLINCANAVKKYGLIWIYFYRSGTFKWFVNEMIRGLLSVEDIDRFFISSAINYANGNLSNPHTSQIMDDFFVPYINLYSPQQYITFMSKLGFELYSSSHSDPLSSVNHNKAHHSAVLVFKKNTNSVNAKDLGSLLQPNDEINQLDKKIYSDKETKDIIDIYNKLKEVVLNKKYDVIRYSTCLALHKIAAPQYYGEPALPPKRKELKILLENTYIYLNKVINK
ncbi:MAG: hypothetical protein CMJ08_03640 [Pelagibacterales bacterium]|nr:hypothetical protein [Pelagibacterales bacterium]